MKNDLYKKPNGDPIAKLGGLVKGIKFAMMTTVDPDGSLNSRPMACQHTEFDGDLWFFTQKTSGKILALMKDQHVNLAYASPSDQRYISISGRAEIVEDPQKAKEIWNPSYKTWFPKGLEDANLVLIKVRVETADEWDSPSSLVTQIVGFAKAVFTGNVFPDSEHERLNLH